CNTKHTGKNRERRTHRWNGGIPREQKNKQRLQVIHRGKKRCAEVPDLYLSFRRKRIFCTLDALHSPGRGVASLGRHASMPCTWKRIRQSRTSDEWSGR